MCKLFPLIGWLSKEMGLPYCIKSMLIQFPKASHSTLKVFMKSGITKIGAQHISSLRCSKSLVASGVHENAYIFNNVVRGAAILP